MQGVLQPDQVSNVQLEKLNKLMVGVETSVSELGDRTH
jgi:hypothetical protein